MAETTQILRELHRIHIQLADVTSRLERGPRAVKSEEAKVGRLDESLQQAKEQTKQTKLMVSKKELQLTERETKILDTRGKLNACSSNREYQAFLEQIAAHEQANSVLSDEIIEGYERVKEHEATVRESEQQLARGKEELAQAKTRVDQQKQTLEGELARLNQLLRDTEKQLPETIKSDYLRLAKSRGEETLAAVEGGICQGCYQTITPQTLNELLQQRPVFCKSCGRLLYLPEDRRVGQS